MYESISTKNWGHSGTACMWSIRKVGSQSAEYLFWPPKMNKWRISVITGQKYLKWKPYMSEVILIFRTCGCHLHVNVSKLHVPTTKDTTFWPRIKIAYITVQNGPITNQKSYMKVSLLVIMVPSTCLITFRKLIDNYYWNMEN